MPLFFLFILFLLLENLFLPALIGPRVILIMPIFLISMLAYNPDSKARLVQLAIFILLAGFFSNYAMLGLAISFILVLFIYLGANYFTNIGLNLKESASFSGILISISIITLLTYIYAWFSIVISSSYDFMASWTEWKILIEASTYSTLAWSVAFTLLFKYVLKNK